MPIVSKALPDDLRVLLILLLRLPCQCSHRCMYSSRQIVSFINHPPFPPPPARPPARLSQEGSELLQQQPPAACQTKHCDHAAPNLPVYLAQVLLDGSITNGTASDATKATGTAAMGSLGPGSIYVNGTVKDGLGQ